MIKPGDEAAMVAHLNSVVDSLQTTTNLKQVITKVEERSGFGSRYLNKLMNKVDKEESTSSPVELPPTPEGCTKLSISLVDIFKSGIEANAKLRDLYMLNCDQFQPQVKLERLPE